MSDISVLQDRLAFLKIDEATRQALRYLEPVISKAMPSILEEFYGRMMMVPELAKMFNSADHVAHAKKMQGRHWQMIMTGKYDADYLRSVTAIGQAHCRIGLEPRWYIAGYAIITNGMLAAIVAHAAGTETKGWMGASTKAAGTPTLTQMLKAVTTAVMLDMDFAISVYTQANADMRKSMVDQISVSFQSVTDAIAGSTSELNSTAELLTNNAEKTRELSVAAASGSEECSVTVSSVAGAAIELGKAINEISRQVQDSSQIARNAVTQASTTNDRMDELQVAANRIGDVVQLIASVAEQTNLLALNATIEAARAGESGRGFAIVAQEVKALAAQTERATGEIRDQIVAMQRITGDSVKAIKDIGSTIEQMSHITTAIASAVEEQDAATRNIAHSIDQTAQGVTEVTKSVIEVSDRAVETGAAADRVSKAASALSAESERLKKEAEQFRAMKVA